MTSKELAAFCAELKQFWDQCGATVTRPSSHGGPGRTQVSDILNGKVANLPPLSHVEAIVLAALAVAKDAAPPNGTLEYWRGRYGRVEVPPRPEPAPVSDPWPEIAQRHPVLQLPDAERFRDEVVRAVAHLGKRRRKAENALAGSPWLDEELPRRVESRLVELLEVTGVELTGVEAALLVLAPFLHRVRVLEAASSQVQVRPTYLNDDPKGGNARRDYERFLSGAEQARLVARTELPERADSAVPIGWWLFHQWTTKFLDPQLGSTLPARDEKYSKLYSTLDRLTMLIHRTPGDLHRRGGLSREKRHLGLPGKQTVREDLIGLLLVVAWEQAIDIAALPITIVEHLGIPRPVELSQLHTTVAHAVWEPVSEVGIGLIAECHHEAVLEALREHVRRFDAVLAVVREAAEDERGLELLRCLPPHATADRVKPVEKNGVPGFLTPVTRFRLDETRVRELLMGEQLYGDKSLAIRELYQNALDACRYRRARHDYLAKAKGVHFDWDGEITFTQGVVAGRHVLRCTDTGVGMGESELREVFSRAGARFADRREVEEERATWAPHKVELHPNSKFGIGVLSYFMLADEIEIHTRRMGPDGTTGHGPSLRVMIAGPGHLFQIEPHEDELELGTTVTLYLRDGVNTESCVDVLQRVLGIAEFPTTASDDSGRNATWEPFVLKPRPLSRGADGIQAYGALVHGEQTKHGQVVWCEDGGGFLVDGIHVQAPKKRTGRGEKRPYEISGAVVNLWGPEAPRLTVDRSRILDDISPLVENLLRQAVKSLVDAAPTFLSMEWLSDVAGTNAVMADLVHDGADQHAASWRIRTGSPEYFDERHTVLGLDFSKSFNSRGMYFRSIGISSSSAGIPEVAYLWVLMSNSAKGIGVKRIRPSDRLLLGLGESYRHDVDKIIPPGAVLKVAIEAGLAPAIVAARAAEFGFELPNVNWSACREEILESDRAILSLDRDGVAPWLSRRTPISLGYAIASALSVKISLSSVLGRLSFYGFSTPHFPEVQTPLVDSDAMLVDWNADFSGFGRNWLPSGWPVERARVYFLAGLLRSDVTAIAQRFRILGFEVPELCGVPHWLPVVNSGLRRVFLECAVEVDGIVPISQIVRASMIWEISPSEVLCRFADMELSVPDSDQVPDELDGVDRHLLSLEWLDRGLEIGPVRVSLARILRMASEVEVSLGEVANRLRRLGFIVPEESLLQCVYDSSDIWLLDFRVNNRSLPDWEKFRDFDLIVEASRHEFVAPAEIARRLKLMGLDVPDVEHLTEPVVEIDRRLLMACGSLLGDCESGDQVPLALIAEVADSTGASPQRLAERVAALGYQVRSADRLPDRFDPVDMAILRRLDLSRPVSVRDVLEQAVWFELTPEEVADRLAAFDLEVPDLAVELPKLAAKVPRE